MRRTVVALVALALVATACGGGEINFGGDGPVASGGDLLPLCRELTPVAPAPEQFRDAPVYVGNEQPTEEVLAWAEQRPGFEELWVDRDANGWVVVGFTEEVAAARAEAAELFADDGVAVVEVERSLDELLALQEEVHERTDLVTGSSSNVRLGRVELFVPYVTVQVHADLADEFGGEPVCLDGGDPADAPPEGPQPREGDGWRLLVAEKGVAPPFRTGVATTPEQVTEAMARAGFQGLEVDIDLETEVLVWFGEPYGSTCTERRLDDVRVVGGDLLVPEIVDPTDPGACTSDLVGAWAFVVAVERSVLPPGPFTVQLHEGDQVEGAATHVDVDLSQPGATATAEQLGAPARTPKDGALRDGDVVEPGFPADYVIYAHCGVGVLGVLNDVLWVSEDESLWYGETPSAWQDLRDEDEEFVVEVLLETGDPPTVTATANGHSVRYVPGDPAEHGCD